MTVVEQRYRAVLAVERGVPQTEVAAHVAYISGCVPVDADGNLVGEGDVVEQARQTLHNVGLALTTAGSSFANVLKVTVYLVDVEDRVRINPVRQKFFGDALPASTLVQIGALAVPGALIEIEAVAALDA